MDWGAFIKSARIARGLKQCSLGDVIGVDQGTISRWERNSSEPTIAMKKVIREKLCTPLRSCGDLSDLARRVRHSSETVLLTRPGTYASQVASMSARKLLRLPDTGDGSYDWESSPCTRQQLNVYGHVTNYFQMFLDRAITHVESSVAIRLPDGEVQISNSIVVPVWGRGESTRLLIKPLTTQPFEGKHGFLRVVRATEPPELLEVRNE